METDSEVVRRIRDAVCVEELTRCAPSQGRGGDGEEVRLVVQHIVDKVVRDLTSREEPPSEDSHPMKSEEEEGVGGAASWVEAMSALGFNVMETNFLEAEYGLPHLVNTAASDRLALGAAEPSVLEVAERFFPVVLVAPCHMSIAIGEAYERDLLQRIGAHLSRLT